MELEGEDLLVELLWKGSIFFWPRTSASTQTDGARILTDCYFFDLLVLWLNKLLIGAANRLFYGPQKICFLSTLPFFVKLQFLCQRFFIFSNLDFLFVRCEWKLADNIIKETIYGQITLDYWGLRSKFCQILYELLLSKYELCCYIYIYNTYVYIIFPSLNWLEDINVLCMSTNV